MKGPESKKPEDKEAETKKEAGKKVSDAVGKVEEKLTQEEEVKKGLGLQWQGIKEGLGATGVALYATLKLIEFAAYFAQGVIENFESPTKWFAHIKEMKKSKEK